MEERNFDIKEVRERTAEIDRAVAELLNERQKLCRDAAEFRIRNGKSALDRLWERQEAENLERSAGSDAERRGVRELFREILSISRKSQYAVMKKHGIGMLSPYTCVDRLETKGKRAVFQGVEGAYSHAAMMQYFGEDVESFHVPTFEAAMKAVAEKEADYAVLPIENSSAGQVGDVYDLLVRYDNTIVGETYLPVCHSLLGLPGSSIGQIRTVYSHPQGLMQCQRFLNSHSGWQQISQPNTAMSAKKVLEEGDPSAAAIASSFAGKLYGLQVLQEAVNDNPSNTTRFIVVSSERVYCREAGKVSICFEVVHESGSLYNTLSHIICNDLNMTKIESRPIPDRPFEYRFFVDFEGNLSDPAVENALYGMKEEVRQLKILGNYGI